MTAAMWLTWLLRTDVRAGRPVEDLAAQRDFAAWWLLYGQEEYPAVWWWGPEQARVAMEPAPTAPNSLAPIPRLLLRLHQSRQDLQQQYDLTDAESVAGYLCWYRLAGPQQLPAAPALPASAMAVTEALSTRFTDPALPRMALAVLGVSPALQAVTDVAQPGHRRGLLRWFNANPVVDPAPTSPPAGQQPVPSRGPRAGPRGRPAINLVGFARAEFGIGEDVRMLSRALEAAGIRHTITDVRAASDVRASDLSRAAWIGPAAPGAINIFCLTGFDTGQIFLERGLRPFEGAYNIGYWPWELPRFPDQWADVYGLMDEIWAATTFQAAAYAANSPVPVHLMPPAVTPPSAVPPARTRLERRSGRFTFFYPFDPNSTLARKNPLAAVRAFRAAFPLADRGVALVLRVNGHGAGRPGWQALRAAAGGDRRIRIVEGTLPRAAAQRLLQRAGCLVSPHRAEGLGRNIAEAIALGVPVLATGFSGSADLLLAHERIPAKPRRVAPGEYPHAAGLWWSEPDWRALARQMRRLRRQRFRTTETVYIRRARHLLRQFGLSESASRYAAALCRIEAALTHR